MSTQNENINPALTCSKVKLSPNKAYLFWRTKTDLTAEQAGVYEILLPSSLEEIRYNAATPKLRREGRFT